MTGDKYLEPGSQKPVRVHRRTGLYGEVVYKIFQGSQCYQGRFGEMFLQEKSWTSEADAQRELDRIARVYRWKKVSK